jgi:hypothetical protein
MKFENKQRFDKFKSVSEIQTIKPLAKKGEDNV